VEGAAFALSSLRPFAARLIPDAAPSAAIPLSIVTRTPPAARVTAWRLKFRVNADNPQTAGIGVHGPCKVEVTAEGALLANGGSTAVADVRVEWEDVLTHNAEQAERRREEAAEHARREADQAKKWLQEKVRSCLVDSCCVWAPLQDCKAQCRAHASAKHCCLISDGCWELQ
jgi:hypothetical protein